MSDLLISEICDSDVEAVIALWRACGLTRPWNDPQNDIAFARSKATSAILVARREVEGPIVSSVMVGHDGHRGWVYYLSVCPEQQGAGYGKAMMKEAEAWQLDQGVWKQQLLVRTGNEAVKSFYESLGYNVSACMVLERWIDPSKRGDGC